LRKYPIVPACERRKKDELTIAGSLRQARGQLSSTSSTEIVSAARYRGGDGAIPIDFAPEQSALRLSRTHNAAAGWLARATRRSAVLGITILTVSCGSDSISGPSRTALSGTVVLQDAWGNDLDDFSGVAVTVDGLSLTAVSDKDGSWRIDDVPAGRHDLTLAKATFGTMRILGQDVSGTSTGAPKITMAETPTVQALIDSIYVGKLSGISFYFVDGHLSAPPPANSKLAVAVIFLSKSVSVSPGPASYDQWNASLGLDGKSSTFTMALPVDGTRATFGAGTELFVAGFSNSAACSCYDDPATKKRIFTNTGPRGNVVRLTVQ
jgi:hypothetical protein